MWGRLSRVLGCALVLVSASGCYELSHADRGGPRVAPARTGRASTGTSLDADTTLDELPPGQARRNDFAVRVYRSGRGAGSCSGAVIGPTLVITALHCVVSMDAHMELTTHVRPAGELHVELGGDYLPWGRVGVLGVRTCGPWTTMADGDIAVVELSKPLPPDVPILTVSTGEPRSGELVSSYGFGNEVTVMIPDTSWRVESVRRHERQHTSYGITDGSILLTGLAVHGDSGGPVVSQETGELIAVLSQGTDGITSSDGAGGPRPHRLEDEMTVGARVDHCREPLGLR